MKCPQVHPGRRFAVFRQGFVTSMANPFAVVFFGALFPQFIDASLPVMPQLFILGLTYLVVDGAILLLWGWSGVRAATALKGLVLCGAEQGVRVSDDRRRCAFGQQGFPAAALDLTETGGQAALSGHRGAVARGDCVPVQDFVINTHSVLGVCQPWVTMARRATSLKPKAS